MTTSNTTPNRGYDEPHAGNQLKDDVERLIAAIRGVDSDMAEALQSLASRAPISSPAFTGAPEAPTPDAEDDSNRLATTAFVKGLIGILTGPNAISVDSLEVAVVIKTFLGSETLATARENLNVPETEAVAAALATKADAIATAEALATKADATALADKLDKNGSNAGSAGDQATLRSAIGVGHILHVRDEKASGGGGASSAATWNVRVLNTVKHNTIAGASLTSNKVTLPAGTFRVRASAPAYFIQRHQLAFYNVTDGAYALVGSSEYTENTFAGGVVTRSFIDGIIALASPKEFELRHYTQSALGNGLGVNAGAPGTVEVYAELIVELI